MGFLLAAGMFIAPGVNMSFAQNLALGQDGDDTDSEQEVKQENEMKNDSFCVDASTVAPTLSCNNLGLGLNLNTGNIAGGQK